MHAAILTSFAGPDAITVADVAEPILPDGHLLLRVDAASVGPWDAQTATGAFAPMGGLSTFPQTLGWDVCGTVDAVGPGVTGWNVGDRAFGFSPQPWTGLGVFAERASLPADLLAHPPTGLDPAVAATLPVVMLTADLAVRQSATTTGSTLLVLGAAGAVGGYVIQFAAQAGATVVASVSAHDHDAVAALGASVALDRDGDVSDAVIAAVGPVDAIIDLVGPAARHIALAALRPNGRLVTTIPGPLPDLPAGATGTIIGVQPDPARLAQLAEQVARGALTARNGARLPLTDARRAFDLAPTAGGAKVVLIP